MTEKQIARSVSARHTKYPREGADDGEISIGNLTREEIEAIEAMLHGVRYIRTVSGRIESHDVYVSLPEPEDDPKVGEEWQQSELQPVKFGKTEYGPVPEWGGVSIVLQHLCGYNWTAENYKVLSRNLKEYGFVCMRSKRGGNGKFWELWFLPGLWMASGALAEYIEGTLEICLRCKSHHGIRLIGGHKECYRCMGRTYDTGPIGKLGKYKTEKDRAERAFEFLMNHVSFGTMDATCQRAAMVIE